jgi:hypothetical protein
VGRRAVKAGQMLGESVASEDLEKIIRSLIRPCLAGLIAIAKGWGRGWGLQAAGWFVTTVKHGTALEALARRRPRLDISTCRLFDCEDIRGAPRFDSNGSIQTYKPTSDGSVAARTAGGELHEAAKFGTIERVDEPLRRDREAAIWCESQNSSSFDRVERVASAAGKFAALGGGLAKSETL